MQILVRSLEETFAVSVNPNGDLNELKAAIEDREFVPSSLQRIVKDGQTLLPGSLAGLEENDTVTLLLDVAGGMRAKWRKKRMRRLQKKRRSRSHDGQASRRIVRPKSPLEVEEVSSCRSLTRPRHQGWTLSQSR